MYYAAPVFDAGYGTWQYVFLMKAGADMDESRRVRLTKKMIKEALIALMGEKESARITVKELCEKADVNRSTFYAYYRDTAAVIKEIEEDILMQLPDLGSADTEEFNFKIFSLFEYIRVNSRVFYVMMFNSSSSQFCKKLMDAILQKYEGLTTIKDERVSRMSYIFCVNGIAGLVKDWIESGFCLDTVNFTKIAMGLALRSISLETEFHF